MQKKSYDSCTKEELLDIIRKLELQVENLTQKAETPGKHLIKKAYSNRILDALPDMLTVITHDGICVDVVSSEKTVHVGSCSSDLINKSIEHFLPPQAYRNIRQNMDTVIRTGCGATADHTLEIEGVSHHFENRIFPLDEKYVLCMCRDVTEQVKTREELENLKYAVNNAMEEIYATNTDGVLQFANTMFIRHYNISPPLQNYIIYNIEPSYTAENWKQYIGQIRHNGGSIKYTTTQCLPDGTSNPLEIVAYIVKDLTGSEIIWTFTRDITLRIDQENTIRNLNYIMDAILNNVPAYLFVKDPGNEFRYLYWNKAFETHSHIPAHQALGHTDAEIFSNPEEVKKFRQDDMELLKKGDKLEFQEEYTTTKGEIRIVNTLKTLVHSQNEKLPLIIGISWDITELKNTEKELIAARIKAEEADKLKSTFLANMSHEIRTPMNAIVGFSQLIAETDDMHERQCYNNIINKNANLLLQLINDILDLSKIEAGTLDFINKPTDLRELCRNIYDIHLPRTTPEVKLVFDDDSPSLTTISDSNRLNQVISNFLTNAQKFTNQGEIRFGFKLTSDHTIEFYVKDTGIGIPKEQTENIFNRFTKLNNFAQGSGLGLAICKMITESLGGNIWVESIENEGSTFKFTIPYHPNAQTPEIQTPLASVKKNTDGRKTILVAEDVDSNYLLLTALIGKTYTLIRAVNGLDAVALFRKEHPDLILMDIKMPEMDGLEATRAIRQEAGCLPIIALTAFAFETDKREALDAGCNDFLTKPIVPALLRKTIEKYI